MAVERLRMGDHDIKQPTGSVRPPRWAEALLRRRPQSRALSPRRLHRFARVGRNPDS
jgi:hypothetical protein